MPRHEDGRGYGRPGHSVTTLLTAVALAAAMLAGGSGSLVPGPEIVLQCLLAAVIAAWVWCRPDGLRHVPRGAWIIAAVIVALPVCQLLPLPPVVWQALPGREVERAALDLVGQASGWRPLSLTPDRTLAALLAMAAAGAMLVMTAALDREGRTVLLATAAAIALLSVLVGAAQSSGGAGGAFRFYNPDEPFLDGFQTSHNAQADVLLIGMVMLAAAAAEWAAADPPARAGPGRGAGRAEPWIAQAAVGGASLLLMLGVVLTASRSGIALLPLAVAAQLLILRRRLPRGVLRDRRVVAIAIVAVAVLVGAALALGRHGTLAAVVARFHTALETRPEIWRDALFAARRYWPWGAGMGSFVPVFAAVERLEVVTGKFVNRAHDDYLELLIEAGLPGILALGGICWVLAGNAWRGLRGGGGERRSEAQLICGVAGLGIIAVHSLDDYPLRTMSLACMTAVSAGLLLPIAERGRRGIRRR